ncbi:MAG: zinc dependent phospholipase C family protein [Bacillota bacterium]|nr:zinc dependent phospholipase C family protein [Bacillota bacterium]
MPDFWSHQLASEKIKTKFMELNPSYFIWDSNLDPYYYFGAQGPDFFFYINQPRPYKMKRYKFIGNHLHTTEIRKTFEIMFEYLRLHPSQALKAYVAGYITHYILDFTCHPLICKWGPDSKSHKEVELVLDAMVTRYYKQKPIHEMSMNDWRFDPLIMTGEIGAFWQHVLNECQIGYLPRPLYLQATKDMKIIQDILLKDTISKLPFISLLSRLFKYDLKMLSYPKSLSEDHYNSYDFDEFREAYMQGIQISTIVLKQIDKAYTSQFSLDSIIEEYFYKSYLGEANLYVRNIDQEKRS